MAFFKVTTNEESVRDYTGNGSKWLNKSGVYEIIVKAVIADTTAKGSEYLNLWVEYEGQTQPLFQAMRLTNNDGSRNLGADLFNKFCIIAGATEGTEISKPLSRMLKNHPKAKKVIQTLFLLEGNPYFDFMFQATQYSDFVSRATHYQLMIEKVTSVTARGGKQNPDYIQQYKLDKEGKPL